MIEKRKGREREMWGHTLTNMKMSNLCWDGCVGKVGSLLEVGEGVYYISYFSVIGLLRSKPNQKLIFLKNINQNDSFIKNR